MSFPQHDSSNELLDAFAARFVNRTRPYAVQQEDGTYRWRYEEVTSLMVSAQLQGELTLALSSSNEAGQCRWVCLDVDAQDGLPHLLRIRATLAQRGQPALVEAIRRGGHLWLFLEGPQLVATVRAAIYVALDVVRLEVPKLPDFELYPDETNAPHTFGHAVRLPLGVHRLTGGRYALFDEYGLPCAFTSNNAALQFAIGWPNVPMSVVLDLAATWVDTLGKPVDSASIQVQAPCAPGDRTQSSKVSTRSIVIRWVDAEISPLDLLDELAPDTEMLRRGQGYLGWCPFHDDRAADGHGHPGTPSFYVVHNARYGWSWRCLSTNCVHSQGPMRHTFRLLQELTSLDTLATIQLAAERWSQINGRLEQYAQDRGGN